MQKPPILQILRWILAEIDKSWYSNNIHFNCLKMRERWKTKNFNFLWKKINKLDSMRWFSQRRSPPPHWGGGAHRGLWPPKPPNSNLAEIFVQCTYPKFHHPMFTLSEVIVLTDKHTYTNTQTNRRRWKHPTLFATPRRWVMTNIILCTIVD